MVLDERGRIKKFTGPLMCTQSTGPLQALRFIRTHGMVGHVMWESRQSVIGDSG